MAAIWSPDGSGGYQVYEMGMLAGHQRSDATALNDLTDVVGYSVQNGFRSPVRFIGPGFVEDLSWTGIFDPRSVNDKRVLVDGSFTAKRLDLTTMTVTDLGLPTGLPQNYLATSAASINDSNQVCGLAILTTSTSCDRQAARYTDGVGWEIFSGCGPANGAVDMNAQGDVVMRLNVAPYVRFEGLGTFLIEDLIEAPVGHWSVINGFGMAINDARQMAVTATNAQTGQTGVLLLTPETDVGTPTCFGDGLTVGCPCSNESPPGSAQGCLHSAGVGAGLAATGSASVAADDLVLQVSSARAGAVAVFLQGAPAPAQAFMDGLLCATAPILRLQATVLDGTGAASSSVSIVTAGQVAPGTTRVYQTWFRDVGGPCGSGSNASAGLRIDWL